jgi:hypothetical protein
VRYLPIAAERLAVIAAATAVDHLAVVCSWDERDR